MPNATHLITIDGVTNSIILSDYYEGNGSNIGPSIGIQRVAENGNVPAKTRPIEIGAALKNGLLLRLNIRYTSPTNNNKTKTGRIVCPIDKGYEAVVKLKGKQYRGGVVQSVSVPQKVRFT